MALKNLFPTKTTASVMSQFRKVIDDLAHVRDAHFNLADVKEAEASGLLAQASEARVEASKADETLVRLQGVFGVTA